MCRLGPGALQAHQEESSSGSRSARTRRRGQPELRTAERLPDRGAAGESEPGILLPPSGDQRSAERGVRDVDARGPVGHVAGVALARVARVRAVMCGLDAVPRWSDLGLERQRAVGLA